MDQNSPPSPGDQTLRFLFEQADIRGEMVQLDTAYGDILNLHQYAPGVARLLGEFLAAAVLLSTSLKFEGKLILQARSEGQVPLLMVECTSDLQVRAIVTGAEQATAEAFGQLLHRGHLAITIDPSKGNRYQGIVPLRDSSLAANLEAYFDQSEQLATRFWLAADGERAAGMLVQQLPAQQVPEPGERLLQWEHVCTLAATLKEEELLQLLPAELLYRLYHEDPVRLFQARPVAFQCSCSRDRTFSALSSLGAGEVEEILQEQGSVTMDCEFCHQQYVFSRDDLATMLDEPSRTLH